MASRSRSVTVRDGTGVAHVPMSSGELELINRGRPATLRDTSALLEALQALQASREGVVASRRAPGVPTKHRSRQVVTHTTTERLVFEDQSETVGPQLGDEEGTASRVCRKMAAVLFGGISVIFLMMALFCIVNSELPGIFVGFLMAGVFAFGAVEFGKYEHG